MFITTLYSLVDVFHCSLVFCKPKWNTFHKVFLFFIVSIPCYPWFWLNRSNSSRFGTTNISHRRCKRYQNVPTWIDCRNSVEGMFLMCPWHFDDMRVTDIFNDIKEIMTNWRFDGIILRMEAENLSMSHIGTGYDKLMPVEGVGTEWSCNRAGSRKYHWSKVMIVVNPSEAKKQLCTNGKLRNLKGHKRELTYPIFQSFEWVTGFYRYHFLWSTFHF